MRCITCGRDSAEGQWGPDGFVCELCIESYDYSHCEGCGLEFPRSELKEYGGGEFCERCYKGIVESSTPSGSTSASIKNENGRKEWRPKDEIIETTSANAQRPRWKGFKSFKFPSIFSILARLIAGDDDEEDNKEEKTSK